jgi:beta-1,4-mannosyl-glycoprotein beta-1,4-N-acetylglucosaminyltransferase
MKIFDCTTFYSEHLMMDVRFNVLNEYVHKFIVSESTFSHSGKPKKLNFDINNYPKFKDKIIYVIIDKEPNDIIKIEDKLLTSVDKRSNSVKRIELSYDYMAKSLDIALDNDLIILSDNDEIPNLGSNNFKNSNKDIFIFKQLFFYYKFNLLYDLVPWYGSKAAKKKKLLSMSWLKNLKNKKYPFWRLDTLFSNNKYVNLDIINDGGWHFTNLKTPEELYQKLTNFGHHDEFELSGLTVNDLKKKIEEKKVFFNHFLDKENYKERWNYNYKLKKIENELLPKYLKNNLKKFKEWFD